MLIIDQTVGEVETSPVSEAGAGCSETLLHEQHIATNTQTDVKTNTNNANKIGHVTTHEIDIKPKESKPVSNSNNHVQVSSSKESNHGHSHGHSHSNSPQKNSKSAAVILTIGLTVHNILEGVAIGLSPSQEKLVMILIGICPHNLLESFYLGMMFIKSNWLDATGYTLMHI